MRMLRVVEFLSLDGVMQGAGSVDEDTDGGFRHGGWQPPYLDETLFQAAGKSMATTDAYLFGRRTYEKMAAYWPSAPDDDAYAKHLNTTRKYVVSGTLRHLEWNNATLLQGDVATEVAALKARPGKNIVVLGSGELAQTLIANDLVDEYFLVVYPIVLGSGKRLFRDTDEPRKLRLIDSRPTGTGGVMLTYRPATRDDEPAS